MSETYVPPLPFRTNALEPFMNKTTLENMYKGILPHYIKMYNTYQFTDTLPDILLSQGQISENETEPNNDALHYTSALYNYALYLPILQTPTYKIEYPNEQSHLAECIKTTFGQGENLEDSFSVMYSEFMKKAMACINPGWVFLTYNTKRKKLYICSFEKHDNPLLYVQQGQPLRIPIMAINMWEHSYYLQYEYRKSDYLKNIWFLINWKAVEQRFVQAQDTLHPLQISFLYNPWTTPNPDSNPHTDPNPTSTPTPNVATNESSN